MSVSYGEAITCEINPGTDTNVYRFSAIANDRVLVEADWARGDYFSPKVKLYAPDGSALSEKWSPAQIDMVLPQTGTYMVYVSDDSYYNDGSYTFMVSCAGGSCLPTGNTLCSGATHSSDFKNHIPVLNYQFDGGTIPCWADFVYQPDSSGNILFKLVDFGLIQ